MDSMIVWVLAANLPARRFYEAQGGSLYKEQLVDVGGARLLALSYEWESLDSIISNPPGPTGS